MAGPCVVVVDDNRLNLDSLRRVLARRGFTPCPFFRCDDAYAEIEKLRDPPAGALIDVCLDHGRYGFDLAYLLRRRFARIVPVMMFTGYSANDFGFRQRALEMRAELLEKPVSTTQLTDFLVRAALSPLRLQPALHEAVIALASDCGLLPQEVRIVGQLGAGTNRADLSSLLGVSSDTVKWQVKRLLAKTGAKSTRELVNILLRYLCADRQGSTYDRSGGDANAPTLLTGRHGRLGK